MSRAPLTSREVYPHHRAIRAAWDAVLQRAKDANSHLLAWAGEEDVRQAGDPLLRFEGAFNPCIAQTRAWWETWLKELASGDFDKAHYRQMVLRKAFRDMLTYSFPCREALAAVAAFAHGDPVTEYMAGSGYWAWLLASNHRIAVDATDGHKGYPLSRAATFLPVRHVDIRFAEPVPGVAMLMWPPVGEDLPNRFLRSLPPGHRLVYVGEWGGCTGDEETEKILDEEYEEAEHVPLPRFEHLHDGMWLLRKRG